MYLGYSDPKGVIYIFDGEFRKPIVQLHHNLNQRGFENILNGYELTNNEYYTRGFQINSQYVILSKLSAQYGSFHISEHQSTAIWYKKKYKMVPGFQLPHARNGNTKFDSFSDFVALNSTHFLLLWTFAWHMNVWDVSLAVMNFYSGDVTFFSEEIFPDFLNFLGCRFTIGMGGSSKDIEHKMIYFACILGKALPDVPKSLFLLSYDLNDGTEGQFRIMSESETYDTYVMFIHYDARGFLHIAFMGGAIVNYDLEADEMKVSHILNEWIINAIPYYR